jgi:hypothetical protein
LAPVTEAAEPVEVIEISEEEIEEVKRITAPSSPAPSTTTTTTTSTIPPKARTASSVPKETKSYRKSYSAGRREQQNPPVQQNNAHDLKELLKQSGTLSLSEILQQKNLSLADFLQGKKMALSAIKEQQSAENEVATQKQEQEQMLKFESTKISIISSTTERSPAPKAVQTAPPRLQQDAPARAYPEIVYRSPGTTRRPADLYRGTQRSSYLKRTTTTPPPKHFEENNPRHWLSEDGEKADSREDILELLQPGSPVSLAALLSSRNMTLAELMDHRERGSRQQSLVALFTDLANGVTTTASPRLADSPKRKNKGNRDPRLLDLPRRFTLPPEEAEENETEEHASNVDKVTVEHYDYVEEDEEDYEDGPGLPTAVKSAIIASGGLLSVTLALFAAIFLCCRAQQRRQRGSRVPFIHRGKHIRTVIKPVSGNHRHDDPNVF